MGSNASRPAPPPPAPSPPVEVPAKGKKNKKKLEKAAKGKGNAPPTYKQAVKGSKKSKQRSPDPSSPSTVASSPGPQTPVLKPPETKKERKQALKEKKKAEKKARSELKKATAAQAKAEKIAQEAPQRIEEARLKAIKKTEKMTAKAAKRAETATARAAEATGLAANYGTSPTNPPRDWKPTVAVKTTNFVAVDNVVRQNSAPAGWEPPKMVHSFSRSAPVSPVSGPRRPSSTSQRSRPSSSSQRVPAAPPNLPPRRQTASKIPGAYPRVPPHQRLPDYAAVSTDTFEHHVNHRKLALEREYADTVRRSSR